eukprot:9083130-Pyramimonas_sp.AAC.1
MRTGAFGGAPYGATKRVSGVLTRVMMMMMVMEGRGGGGGGKERADRYFKTRTHYHRMVGNGDDDN